MEKKIKINIQLFAEPAPTDEPIAEPKPDDKPEVDYKSEYERLKIANDKLAAENAKRKREEREKMDEEERAKADREAELKEIEEIKKENKTIKTRSELAKFINDDKILEKTTSLFVDGDITNALKEVGLFVESKIANTRKDIEQELLTKNPKPDPATTPIIENKEFSKMSYNELSKLKQDNPDLYKQLMNK